MLSGCWGVTYLVLKMVNENGPTGSLTPVYSNIVFSYKVSGKGLIRFSHSSSWTEQNEQGQKVELDCAESDHLWILVSFVQWSGYGNSHTHLMFSGCVQLKASLDELNHIIV